MDDSVFIKAEFFAYVFFSFVLPISLYAYLMWKRAISRKTVFLFGVVLICIAGVSVALLQRLAESARLSPNLLDDRTFISELAMALYLLPALFAGIGINMISHLLTSHLAIAENRYDREHSLIPSDACRSSQPAFRWRRARFWPGAKTGAAKAVGRAQRNAARGAMPGKSAPGLR